MFVRILFMCLLSLQFCSALTIIQDGEKTDFKVISVLGDSVEIPVEGDLI